MYKITPATLGILFVLVVILTCLIVPITSSTDYLELIEKKLEGDLSYDKFTSKTYYGNPDKIVFTSAHAEETYYVVGDTLMYSYDYFVEFYD